MVKVGFIVEGESEKLVVESPMFQQWLHDHDCTLVTPVIDAKGGGNLLPQQALILFHQLLQLLP